MITLYRSCLVALVDLRARGESGGELTSPGPSAATDVRADLAPALPVLLYGFSRGVRTVLFAAGEDGAHAQAPLAGVIAEGPPYSLRESFMRKRMRSIARRSMDSSSPSSARAEQDPSSDPFAPTLVMVLGTLHLNNPGRDVHNTFTDSSGPWRPSAAQERRYPGHGRRLN